MLRPGTPEEAGMLPERVAFARDLCERLVKEGKTTALSVCVARRGVIVLHEAFGRLRPENDAPPLERSSLYPLSSATKPITATLVMQLVEDGLVGVNRPVREYLPEIQNQYADEMLVHHLLTHTSGYAWQTDEVVANHVLGKLAAGFEPPPCAENQHPLLNEAHWLLCDCPLVCRPGEQMIYNNQNYEVLGELVRRVSGRAIEDLARERIFDPLGMDDTWYVVPESESTRVVQRPPEAALEQDGGKFFEGFNSRQLQETPLSGMGAFSTPRDLLSFDQVFLNGGRYGDARILSRPAVEAMMHNQIPGVPAKLLTWEFPEASWGYGWTIESSCKWPSYMGGLMPLGTCNHTGMGGVLQWIDPVNEIVGTYFEVALEIPEDLEMKWHSDLFVNAVTAAVAD